MEGPDAQRHACSQKCRSTEGAQRQHLGGFGGEEREDDGAGISAGRVGNGRRPIRKAMWGQPPRRSFSAG